MIKTQATYVCDGCQKELDSPRLLARIKVQWEMQWEADTVDLCKECMEPIAAAMAGLNVRHIIN